jgi:hypothetical protein
MGLTTWVAARFFLQTITAPGVLTVLVAQTREAAQSTFRMVQRFYDGLPEELRRSLRRSRANVGQMVFAELDSEFRVVSAADRNAGRGLTIQNLHCSELSRWPGDAAETLAGLRAALVPTGELVFESTPNGAAGCFYDEWQRAAASGLVRHFLPWWQEPAYTGWPATDLRDEERQLVERHGLTPAQIGFRRGLESSYRGLRVQEFAEDPESCFRSSGECCFELEPLMARLDQLPLPVERRRNGCFELWCPPQAGLQYVVACDPAGGGPDGDFAAVEVVDVETGIQCAELREHLPPLELARFAAALAHEYNGAILAVERNNHGHAVLASLAGGACYPRVYTQQGKPGWLTAAHTKPAAVGRLGDLLAHAPGLFLSRRLLAECRTFVRQGGESYGAASGAHDDLVIAMAIAHSVRAELLASTRRTEARW